MSLDELKAMDINGITSPDAHLWLWTTNPHLPEGLELMAAWGFTYKSLLTWDKKRIGTGWWLRCVPPDTRILMRDLSWEYAGNLQVGNKIIGLQEEIVNHKRRLLEGTVTALAEDTLPCYDLYLADGTRLRASAEHKWLIRRHPADWPSQWATAEQIHKTLQSPQRTKPLHIPRLVPMWEPKQDRDSGYLAGALDGEGCLQMRKHNFHITFTQCYNEMLDETRRVLDDLGLRYTLRHNAHANPKWKDTATLLITANRRDMFRLLMEIRPPRLVGRFLEQDLSASLLEARAVEHVEILEVAAVGPKAVVKMETDCRTFIAEGFGAHNSRTEHLLLGVKSNKARVQPGATSTLLEGKWRKHSQKPEEQYPVIEKLSPGPRLELFARTQRLGWTSIISDAPPQGNPYGQG